MSKTMMMETLFCIALFTYFGVLTRMALSTLSQTHNTQLLPEFVSSFFLANIVGSFIMGVFVPLGKLFSTYYLTWYVGVTTDFCGSCTTFSTWQRVTAAKLANGHIVDGLMTLLITFCTSYATFIWRGHRFDEVAVTITNTNMSTTQLEQGRSVTRYVFLFFATVFASVAIWISLFIDTSSEVRQRYWVATALGPPFARFFLLRNNRNRPTFPLFTFIVNVSASIISTVILVVFIRLSSDKENENLLAFDLWLSYGVGAGILGCFSTVSTFVNELSKLGDTNISNAYRYGLLSVFVSQILCIPIICTFL